MDELKNLNIENICLINYPEVDLFEIRERMNKVNISVFLFNSYPKSIFYRTWSDLLCEDCTFNIKGFCREYFHFPLNCKRCHFNFNISCLIRTNYFGQDGTYDDLPLENCYFTGEIRVRNNPSLNSFYLCYNSPIFINCYFDVQMNLENKKITNFGIFSASSSGKNNSRVSFLNKDAITLPETCNFPEREGEFYFLDYDHCCDPNYLLDELGFPVIQTDE